MMMILGGAFFLECFALMMVLTVVNNHLSNELFFTLKYFLPSQTMEKALALLLRAFLMLLATKSGCVRPILTEGGGDKQIF